VTRSIVVVAVLAFAALVVGCGNEALRVNATVARAMLEVQSQSSPIIRDARVAAAVESARAVHDSGGEEAVALEAAQATAERWQCAVDGHRSFAGAVGAYVDALVLWNSGADFALTDSIPFVLVALDAYRSIVSCLRSLGSSALPDVPAFFELIPSEWSVSNE